MQKATSLGSAIRRRIPILFFKARVKAYTKKDGTFVAEHDDKRIAKHPDKPAPKKLTPEERFAEHMAKKTPQDAAAFQAAKADGVAIPPAWTGVSYYGKDAQDGKMATGTDAAGRRQTLETPGYREKQIELKHERIQANLAPIFPAAVDKLRAAAKGGDVASQVLYLITQTAFRIGGKGDGKSKHVAYGASTLLGEHAVVVGNVVTFDFPGKHGVRQQHVVTDSVIADMFRGKAPGEKVFKTSDAKVRAAWKAVGGEKVHDIRSVLATQIAAREVAARVPPKPRTKKELHALEVDVSTVVAGVLGNNPSESLKTYIDYRVIKEAIT